MTMVDHRNGKKRRPSQRKPGQVDWVASKNVSQVKEADWLLIGNGHQTAVKIPLNYCAHNVEQFVLRAIEVNTKLDFSCQYLE